MAMLDRLTGGALLAAASVTGGGLLMSLFDPRAELVRLSRELVSTLSERLSGLGRFERSERLVAAHSVIVVTAFFERLEKIDLPFEVSELQLGRSGQIAFATGDDAGDGRMRELVRTLLHSDVPMPAPQWPYEITMAALHDFYDDLSTAVQQVIAATTAWRELSEQESHQLEAAVRDDLPERALRRYEEMFRRLAGEFPEVAFWANLVDHQATRAEVRGLRGGLEVMERLLEQVAADRDTGDVGGALARYHQVALSKPVLEMGSGEDLVLPPLGDIYVNPDFRAAYVDSGDLVARESWWREHSVRTDLHGFLLGHLTSPQATEAPLLILGQPGSGKSVLTRILAAKLSPRDFLVVRVVLREVRADTDLQSQIEEAIRMTTGEDVSWPRLVRRAGGALPVVMLDGFDELLQATGVNQSDYLVQAARLQRREAEQGRPVAVVVTSRTTVADRARAVDSMIAVQLEPFREAQIERWLGVWNAANSAVLARRHLRPLPLEAVLQHRELTAQPLLLLMLALYDADHNLLQRSSTTLQAADLYERLLRRFAERENSKTHRSSSKADLARAVDVELTRLSIVAFAMFNRNRQWTTPEELDGDLSTLLPEMHSARGKTTSMQSPLSDSELTIGRFFFIHEARAQRGESQLSTYEFLHATFGEYLVARLVVHELDALAAAAELAAAQTRRTPIDDAFLHALLSYAALTTRQSTVDFLRDRLVTIPAQRRPVIRDLLLRLFHGSLEERSAGAYDGYRPAAVSVPGRHAAYAANLMLLITLLGTPVAVNELFPDRAKPIAQWRRLAYLWRAQLTAEGWSGLVHSLKVNRSWRDTERSVIISFDRDETPVPPVDPYWSYAIPPGDERRGRFSRWRNYSLEDVRHHVHFMCDDVDDTMAHALEPLTGVLDPTFGTLHGPDEERAFSPAYALLTLWLSNSRPDSDETTLTTAYDACLTIALDGFFATISQDDRARTIYRKLVLYQLAAERDRLPSEWLSATLQRLRAAARTDPNLEALIESLALHID
ncbi:hypothetical protein ETD83_02345 [Actinomadura soli]|uniref:AAA+ ATPase domain-containing protein n=1 Tax=Actinomadura soli TaxID=2508997 RepID=A0A5C4JJK7_9ACTN|nr:hypothetical protein [Actinomadura soli]TMR07000.1 hypothetical protein ETD83_02345 [Actinomadura soli]